MASGLVNKPIQLYKKNLQTGDDLNSLYGVSAVGFYHISESVANSPVNWAHLIVLPGTGTYQVIFKENVWYGRAYTGYPLAWTAWRKITLSAL